MKPEALTAIEAYRLHVRDLAPDTRKHYLSSIRRFFRRYTVTPETVSPEHIERYVLNSGLSLTAATAELTRLGTFFGFLVRQGQLSANPCAQANLRPLRWALAERRIARRGIVREHVHVRERPEEPLMLRPAKTTDPRDEAVVAFAQRMRRKHYSRQYIKDCVSTLRRFLAFCPGLTLEAVTAQHVERFLDAQALSPRSYATNVERIRAFYRYLIRHQDLAIRNPTEDVETPRRPVRLRPAPTREEFTRLVAATQNPEERLLVEFTYYTGARLSELRGIRLRDGRPRAPAGAHHREG
jgi:site-specific recombinase XerD